MSAEAEAEARRVRTHHVDATVGPVIEDLGEAFAVRTKNKFSSFTVTSPGKSGSRRLPQVRGRRRCRRVDQVHRAGGSDGRDEGSPSESESERRRELRCLEHDFDEEADELNIEARDHGGCRNQARHLAWQSAEHGQHFPAIAIPVGKRDRKSVV